MALISTKGAIPSDVIAYEQFEEFGYCRLMVTGATVVASATYASEDWVIGSVLCQTNGAGTWHLIDADDVTADADLGDDMLAIVIDPNVATAVDGDKLLCLVNGVCGVRNLHYGDVVDSSVVDTRLAALGIRVEDAISPTLA